ncbi:invasion associated locus B family protein [Mesorhizobium atlanticum]|uniref:invasion associated locus B family protein n=1 Tax=Mesorhizobium atlanticum TaxID=2233532 RepID=UPI003CCA7BCF
MRSGCDAADRRRRRASAAPVPHLSPRGCVVDLSVDSGTLAALRKGSSLKVKVVADGGKETNLALSLKGFPSALDKTTALLQ